MTDNIVVMPGSACIDSVAVQTVARRFGWTVEMADDLSDVCAAQSCRRTTALLFHRDAFGCRSWLDAVRLLRFALPEVRLVACHGFSESIDWPELCDAGAFHSLWLPLKENEVRRSFGFVWEAEKRRAELTERVPTIVPPRNMSPMQRINPVLARGGRARVMTSATG